MKIKYTLKKCSIGCLVPASQHELVLSAPPHLSLTFVHSSTDISRSILKCGKQKANWFGTSKLEERHSGRVLSASVIEQGHSDLVLSDPDLAMGPSPARLVPPPHLTGVPLSTSGELCTTKKDGSWGISSDKWPGSALFHQEITGVVRGTGNMSTFTTSGLAQKGICTPLLLRNTGACGQNGQERLSQNKWLSLDPLCF